MDILIGNLKNQIEQFKHHSGQALSLGILAGQSLAAILAARDDGDLSWLKEWGISAEDAAAVLAISQKRYAVLLDERLRGEGR